MSYYILCLYCFCFSGSSIKYKSRENQGSVVHSYGPVQLLRDIDECDKLNMLQLNITQLPNEDGDLYTKAM